MVASAGTMRSKLFQSRGPRGLDVEVARVSGFSGLSRLFSRRRRIASWRHPLQRSVVPRSALTSLPRRTGMGMPQPPRSEIRPQIAAHGLLDLGKHRWIDRALADREFGAVSDDDGHRTA